MQLYYAPDLSKNAKLPIEESKHCMKILRHQIGDIIHVTDGLGFFYDCEISDSNGSLIIRNRVKQERQRAYHLHLAVAPTKNGERTDWMIEKLVEFGIDELTFLDCSHNERNKINLERCERVAISAMKQSVKAYHLKINNIISWSELLKRSSTSDTRLIAHCDSSFSKIELQNTNRKQNILYCIGPEGDFSKQEITSALSQGFEGVSLGASRLRTETAAIAVCSFFYFQ